MFVEGDIINYLSGEYKDHKWVAFYFESGTMQHFCGYIKIPKNHPWYKVGIKRKYYTIGMERFMHRNYDDIPLHVHGGLTFAELVTERNKNNYLQPFSQGLWVGWDYSHAGDRLYLPEDRMEDKPKFVKDMWKGIDKIDKKYKKQYEGSMLSGNQMFWDKQWTIDEVIADCQDAVEQLIKSQ